MWILTTVRSQGDVLSTWDLVPAMVVAGIGLGLLVVPLVDVALATVPTAAAGAASGTYGTVQQVGAALGVAVIGTVFFGVAGASYDAGALRDGVVAACWAARPATRWRRWRAFCCPRGSRCRHTRRRWPRS